MTTSPQRPGVTEKLSRNLALLTLNFEGFVLDGDDMAYVETILHRPVMQTWLAGVLNRRTQQHRKHYFYNQELRCLDYHELIEPAKSDSQSESEKKDGC